MTDQIPEHYVRTYESTLRLALQQMDARLLPHCSHGSYRGQTAAVVDEVEPTAMNEVTGRTIPKSYANPALTRRTIKPRMFSHTQIIDSFDALKLLSNPQSKYVENARAAAMRNKDLVIVQGAFGTAWAGQDGGTAKTWASENTGQVVDANVGGGGSATGLNVDKLIAAREILLSNENDPSDEFCIAYTAKQETDMLKEIKAISGEFNGNKAVLVDGKLTYFLGFHFVRIEDLTLNSSSERRLPAFSKRGLHFGEWDAEKTSIGPNKALEGEPIEAYRWQVYNATRTDPKSLVEIECAES